MRWDAFTGPSYTSQSIVADSQRCVNWYPELIESRQGKNTRFALYPCPGVRKFVELPKAPIRGLFAKNNRAFAAGGSSVYELIDNGSYVERMSGLATDQYPVTWATNGDAGNQLAACSGERVYVLRLNTNVFAGAVASDVTMIDYLDGYILGLDINESRLRISALADAETWTASQNSQRNTAADRWQHMIVANRLIYLFGSETMECWSNQGGSPYPFAAVIESFRQVGIMNPFAGCNAGGTPLFVVGSTDGRGTICKVSGYDPVRISNHAVEYAIQQYTTVTDLRAYSYSADGHLFGVFSFPTARGTWVYDPTVDGFHERLFWNAPLTRFDASRQLFHCFAFGKHLVGDRDGNTVYELRTDTYQDVNAQAIRRLRRTPHLHAEDDWITYHRVALDVETGVGLATGQGHNPQLMLRWSNDGGRTWGNDHSRSAGKAGEYTAHPEWRRGGRARDRVFELVTSDPVPFRIINAYLETS